MPLEITIGIPVYNVEPYIERSLLSALNQDFTESYEILIIDDAGSDQSMEIVKCILSCHPKRHIVRIIHNEKNIGLGEVRNRIFNEARGKYLTFLDSDDFFMPNTLSVLYSKAIETKAEITIGGITDIYAGEEYNRPSYPNITVYEKNAGLALILKGIYTHIEFHGKMFLTSFIREHQIRCIHRIMEDSIPDAISLIEAEKICLVSTPVYYYDRREGSILSSIINKQGTDIAAFVYTDILRKMQDIIQENKDVSGIYNLYMLRVKYSLRSMLSSKWTQRQTVFIDNQLADCLKVVPGLRYLRNKHDRLIYQLCKRKMTLERYRYVTGKFAHSFMGRIVRNMLNLIPCKKY